MPKEKPQEENIFFAGGEPIEDEDLGSFIDSEAALENPPADPPGDGEGEDPPADPPADGEGEDPPADPPADGEGEDPPADPPADGEGEDPPADPPADGEGEDPPADGEGEDPPADPGITVPKSRLDHEAAKRRAAENRAQEAEDALARQRGEQPEPVTGEVSVPLDIGEAPKDMMNKMLDGDLEGASQDFATIIDNVVKQTVDAVQKDTAEQVKHSVKVGGQQQSLDQVIDGLEAEHAFFRNGDPEFDQELVNEVMAMAAGYENAGYDPADAMARAADNGIRLYKPEVLAPADPPADPPAPPAKPSKEVEAGAKTHQQQPPEQPQGKNPPNIDDKDINPLAMTDEEWDALPVETRRRMRGDYLH